MQNGWYTVGEGDTFPLDQRQQRIRQVTTRVDLLDAHGSCHIGNSPGMDVEHGRNGHIDVATMEALVLRGTGQSPKHGHGVQHELPVAKIDSLWVAGGPGGIEGCGARIFSKVWKIEVLSTLLQQV